MVLDQATPGRPQTGSRGSQKAFLRCYAGSLRALVRRLGSGSGELEDQPQEVFLCLLQVLPRFSPEGPARLGPWVSAVAHKQLLAKRRRPRLQLAPIEERAAVAD